MFPITYNDYIIIHLELRYERCKISQNIGGGKSFSQAAQDCRSGKGICHERIVDKVRSIGYGHKLLLKAQKRGLVERKTVKNKVFNKLTIDGKKIVMIAKEIGV